MDYKNGKIYKIVSHQTDKIYIGSTCTPLRKRLWYHKADYRKWKRGKHTYTTSYEIIQYGDAEIILIANAPCNSKEELHSIERSYIEGTECVNKNIPGRTMKEYTEANKEKRKAYYQANKKKIIAQRNQKIECECGAIITKSNLKRHKTRSTHWSEPIGLANFHLKK